MATRHESKLKSLSANYKIDSHNFHCYFHDFYFYENMFKSHFMRVADIYVNGLRMSNFLAKQNVIK